MLTMSDTYEEEVAYDRGFEHGKEYGYSDAQDAVVEAILRDKHSQTTLTIEQLQYIVTLVEGLKYEPQSKTPGKQS